MLENAEAKIPVSRFKPNVENPRVIKEPRFKSLMKSIDEFPGMMELRPIVIDKENRILGGNMRFRALKELGYTSIPEKWVKHADALTDEEKQRFIVIDNQTFGEWDWDKVANGWNAPELESWGLIIPGLSAGGNEGAMPDVNSQWIVRIKATNETVANELYQLAREKGLAAELMYKPAGGKNFRKTAAK